MARACVRGAVVVRRVAFAVPGDLATPTGGYAYDRRMIAELRELGWQVDVIDLGDGFPRPSAGTQGRGARRACRCARADGPIVIDGLGVRRPAGSRACACASDSRWSRWCIIRWRWKPVCRRPTPRRCERASARRLRRRGRRRHQPIDRADSLADGLTTCRRTASPSRARHRSRRDRAQGSSDGIVRLLSVGAVVPRKGFDVLIAALATLADLPWRLTIAGDRTRDPKAAARLDADIARVRICRTGSMCSARCRPNGSPRSTPTADLFVLASRFEGYGMAFAEAIAHGLPVIGTTAGAIPDTVPARGRRAGRAERRQALAARCGSLIENRSERRVAPRGARAARRRAADLGGLGQAVLAGAIEARGMSGFSRRVAGAARALSICARAMPAVIEARGRPRSPIGSSVAHRRSRLRHRLERCARSARTSRPGRTGGWSTTT